jgi:predicted RNA-binding Zn ribbon-like protein
MNYMLELDFMPEGDSAAAAPDVRAPWVLPGEPIAVRLINTVWTDGTVVHDALETPADLWAWLQDTGLSDDRPVSAQDLRDARLLRDALRELAVFATHDERSRVVTGMSEQGAVAVVDRAMHAAPVTDRLVLTPAGVALESVVDAPPVVAAMAAVARDGVALLTDPARPLRPCHEPCVLFFVRDHPRRKWCTPEHSNRDRAARHYERSKSRTDPAPTHCETAENR